MQDENSILKRFAKTDGLLKGTAILSNLITTASISILPGFGTTGLFIANTIQLSIAGALEVPTGIIADRYGWAKATKIALCLKLLVTFCFLLAVISAQIDNNYLVWIFVTCEAVVDSFASSFLSGAYQSAYIQWYERQLTSIGKSIVDAPPLFLSSFKYALKLRFLLPVGITGLVMMVHTILRARGLSVSYDIAYASIASIMILRLVVLHKVFLDLHSKASEKIPAPRASLKNVFGSFIETMSSKYFWLYANAVLVNTFSSFYVIGHVFQLFNQTGLGTTLVWSCGIIFGISIYLSRTLFGVLLYPRISIKDRNLTITRLSWALGCVSLLAGSLIAMPISFEMEFLLFLALALGASVLSDAIQRVIDSSLKEVISSGLQATWLSFANGLGLLLFGLISALILHFDLTRIATSIFCSLICLICVIATFYQRVRTNRPPLQCAYTFSETLSRVFFKSIALAVLVLAIFDMSSFAYNSINMQSKDEILLTKMVVESVKEPLEQGSFTEATRRLKKLHAEGVFYCAKAHIWEYRTNLCGSSKSFLNLTHGISTPLIVGEQSHLGGGHIELFFDRAPLYNGIVARLLVTMLLFAVGGLLLWWVFTLLGTRIQKELAGILNLVNSDSRDLNKTPVDSTPVTILEFQSLAKELQKSINIQATHARIKGVAGVAAQVSHDIRSPLSALEMLLVHIKDVPEEQRVLLRSSVNRIRDIANTLIIKNGEDLGLTNTSTSLAIKSSEPTTTVLLSSIIQSLVAEKRLQYRSRTGIEIDFEEVGINYGIFVSVQQAEFKRALSNLINNAVEAFSTGGQVSLRVEALGKYVRVTVADTGKGIPPDVIDRIGERGFSHDKNIGSGLGIWHCKQVVEEWNGQFTINSILGHGTLVHLELPAAIPPVWFVPEIRVGSGTGVVLLDDDASIHEVWRHRFYGRGIKIFNFKGASDFERWAEAEPNLKTYLFLMDYELLGSKLTGLDLVHKYGLASESILVTSHFESPDILVRCAASRIKILPKSLAPFVPVGPPRESEAVLIDDDELIRDSWAMAAEHAGVHLYAFASAEDFFAAKQGMSKSVPFYIDQNLGINTLGLNLAAALNKDGYTNLYLATGYCKNTVDAPHYIKDVLGKSPPWSF